MSKRTNNVIMSDEARVLKSLREKQKLSMRDAALKMGVSSSLVSQIENGRENPPEKERLQRFLDIYNISLSSYRKMVKGWTEKQSDFDVIVGLLSRLRGKDQKTIRVLVEHLIKEL